MNELARHIASLLRENDCVIVPGFGGFIAHYAPAQQENEDFVFLPPMRVMGFNPQLRINDGLLAQSYMSVYGFSFPEAVKIIQQQSEELISSIHETGHIELNDVGELRYNIHGKYEFNPFDYRLATPDLYGLDSFKMKELKDLPAEQGKVAEYSQIDTPAKQSISEQTPEVAAVAVDIPQEQTEKKIQQETKEVDFNKYWRNAAAAAAIIILVIGSFFFYQPVDKIDIYNAEASVLPKEIIKESIAISSIITHQPSTTSQAESSKQEVAKSISNSAKVQKLYNVIVASMGNAELAEKEAQRLIQMGYSHAKPIIGDGKARVCVDSFENEIDAYRAIHDFKANGQFDAAWVLKK